MIKANELRIGNLVFFEHDWFKGKYAEIICIQSHCVLIKDFRGTPKIEEINPIPLTPEILEKCGGKQNSVGVYELEGYGSQLDFYFDDDGNLIPHEYYTAQVVAVPIKYLHHFQNLVFFASGKELKIKDL